MKKRTKKLLLRFPRLFQGHWPKIINVFLLLFVHKKKFFLFCGLGVAKKKQKNVAFLLWRRLWFIFGQMQRFASAPPFPG